MRIISGRNQDEVTKKLVKLQLLADSVTDTGLYVDITNSIADLCGDVLDIKHNIDFETSLIKANRR